MTLPHHAKRLSVSAAVSTCIILFAACGCGDDDNDYSPVLAFDSARVRLVTRSDTLSIHVELARSAEQQTLGLMERKALPDTAGMLFLYASDQSPTAGFWMFRTRIPLDIAFLDSLGAIVAVRQMEPCTAQLAAGCPSYEPGAPYRAALEVNAGFLRRHGLGLGARVLLPETRAQ
jgi:uncharacterized protein